MYVSFNYFYYTSCGLLDGMSTTYFNNFCIKLPRGISVIKRRGVKRTVVGFFSEGHKQVIVSLWKK